MGAIVKLKHTHLYAGKWRWIPPRWARALGAVAETMGVDLTDDVIVRSRELTSFWESVRDEKAKPLKNGSVVWLIRKYVRSSWYTGLAPRTKEETDHALDIIEDAFGPHLVASIERKHVRQFHDALAEKSSSNKANKVIKWLRRLISYSVELGLRTDNPAFGLNLKHNPPRRQRWTPKEIGRFKAEAQRQGRRSIALAVQLGYDTSQRLGDILSARWSHYDGEGLTFCQAKTNQEVWTPLSSEGRLMLDETSRDGVQIVLNEGTGRPYARVSFNRRFRSIQKAADIREELQFRDLRRTAASEVLSGGGRPEPLTGHRPGSSATRVYEVPDKDASRAAQRARNRDKA